MENIDPRADRQITRMREIVLGVSRSAKPIVLHLAQAMCRVTALPRTPNREEPPRTPDREGLLIDPLSVQEQALVVVTVEVSVSREGEAAVVSGQRFRR